VPVLILAALVASLEIAVPPEEVVSLFEDRQLTFTGGEYQDEVFHYRLLPPPVVEPGREYPAILFLHGAGERGTDNALQLLYLPEQMAQPAWREKYPCYLIAPQCRPDRMWVDVQFGMADSAPQVEPNEQMQVAIGILDDVLQTCPVDRHRVYLTGLSMGGYGSWDLAARYPERFAAVAPICGGGDEVQAAKLAGLPIWAWHGDLDIAVPVERSRRMIEAIRAAGGEPKYTELKDVGHDSWNPAYSDPEGLVPWMFQQQRPERP
jgi:predicted peptidase